MRVVYLFLLGAIVAVFLFLRTCADRKVEKITGKEIVREDEEYLGSWASKTKNSYIAFRLRREGAFHYSLVAYPYNSTVDKYSKMVLSPNSVFDTIEYVFYRIKQ